LELTATPGRAGSACYSRAATLSDIMARRIKVTRHAVALESGDFKNSSAEFEYMSNAAQ
jgi:hypothetical protein